METAKFQSINKVIELISADRERTNILRKSEQKALAFLVQRTPSWISSDMLTAIGFGGNILTFFSFLLQIIVTIFRTSLYYTACTTSDNFLK